MSTLAKMYMLCMSKRLKSLGLRIVHLEEGILRELLKCLAQTLFFFFFEILLFQKLHNKELNIRPLGFMSMVEFMSAMPDVVRIERPTKLDWLLFLATKGTGERNIHSIRALCLIHNLKPLFFFHVARMLVS